MHACLEALGSRTNDCEPLLDRVRMAVRTRLPRGWPSLEAIGEEVRLSPGSIRRELAHFGLTYKELVQSTRRKLAFSYLRQRHLPLSEIAFLLGYSELSHHRPQAWPVNLLRCAHGVRACAGEWTRWPPPRFPDRPRPIPRLTPRRRAPQSPRRFE